MKCPICDAELFAYWRESLNCPQCGVYEQRPSGRHLIRRCGFVSAPFLSGRYNRAVSEIRKAYRHSEWERWEQLVRTPFKYSNTALGAFWCADNGFPLQEQAVRERLAAEQEDDTTN